MVNSNHTRLSIVRQCRLVSIARSSFYYESTGENPLTLRLMRLIDEQFLETPFYGSRQMTRWLRRQGDTVSRKRVRRLMRLLGVHTLFQGLGQPEVQHFDGAVVLDLDVRGLQVAVNDASFVGGFQCLGDLLGDGQSFIDRDRPLRDAVSQCGSLNQLQHQRTSIVSLF